MIFGTVAPPELASRRAEAALMSQSAWGYCDPIFLSIALSLSLSLSLSLYIYLHLCVVININIYIYGAVSPCR